MGISVLLPPNLEKVESLECRVESINIFTHTSSLNSKHYSNNLKHTNMKKTLTLLSVLLFLTSSVFAQGLYQLPNSDFDNWRRTNGNGDDMPTSWHAFDDAQCTGLIALASSLVKVNHNNRITGFGGGYAAEMYAKTVAGNLANGAMSLGQTVVGAYSSNTTSNYIICKSGYEWSFQGVPDSLSFYAKQGSSVNLAGNSITKAFLYTSSTFKDVTSTEIPYEGTWVGYTIFPFSVQGNQTWTRFVTAFKYSGANDLQGTSGGATLHSNYAYNTDNSLSTILRPSKVMISFSTNEGSRVGNENEKLDIDMLRMIYDKGLSSLKIGNEENDSLRNKYNIEEFVTHSGLTGSGTNSGSTHSNYSELVCYNTDADFPQVSATATSKHILSCVVTQATTTNHYAIIKVTHNDNSTFTDTIFFTNVALKPTVTLSSNNDQTVCAGTAINAITVTATNGTATASNLPAGLTFNASTGKITGTPTSGGTYTITVNNSGCQATATGTITVNPLPTINLTNNGVINVCEGQQVNVSATGADTYTWSDGLGSDAVAHPTTSGTYTVTGTNNSTGCSNTATATVTINPRPIVTLTPSATTVCTPATISLIAGGADSYSWAGITSSTNPAIVSAAGTYNVTVTGTNTTTGCSNTASQTVTVNQTPTVQITGNNAFCAGDSSTLTVSSTPNGATFVWSDLSTSSTLKVKNAGKYFVTGTLNGCEGSDTMNVTVHEIPGAPTTTSNTICGMGQVALSASGTGGTCYWYANNTTSESLATGNAYTPTLNTVGTMTYYVSVRSNEGCESNREPVTATAYALPATPTVSNIAHCGAGDFTLAANVSDGSSLQWFSDNEAENAVTNLNVHVDNTTTYYVRSANEHCNSSLEQLTITINPIPAKPTAISATSICDHGTSVLTATPAAGCELNWFETSNVTGTPLPGNETYTTPQLYASRKYYVVSKNTTTGCMSEVDSVMVNVYPKPGLPTVPNASLCAMGDITLTGTTGTNGTTMRWYNADNELKATADSYTTQITATSTTFKVASYNATTGCEGDKVEITVTVSPSIPAPTAAATVYACGGSAVLTASSSATLKWYSASGDSLSMGAIYAVNNITVPTVYKVAAVVGNCESDMVSMTVEPAVVPAAPTSAGNSRCGAGLITLTATVGDGLECRWYDSENSTEVRSENTTYTPNISGTTTYYVEAINASTQCVSATRTPVQAVMNPLPATPTVSNVAYCGAGTYTLTAGANGNTQGGFHWYSDAEGTQEIQSSVEMTTGNTYYVAWIDDQPCRSALASLAVTINPIPEIPTATAPAPYCSNTAVPVTLTATPGNNGDACRWYNADQTYLNIQQNSYGQNLSASTNYYVTTYNTTTGCESDLKLMAVVINPVPATPVVSGQSRCGAGTVTFTGEVSAPNTFRWYSADNAQLFEGGSYTTDALEANANYLVSTVNTETGCESQKVTVTATVHPAVIAPEVTTPQTLCGAGTTTLTASTTQGNSLRWYSDAGGNNQLTPNTDGSYTTPSLTEGESYTYYVGAYNTNCYGPLASITVNVYARPTIVSVTDNNRCGEGDVQLSATASTGAQVRWYETATGGEPSTDNPLTLSNLQAPSTNVRYAEAYDGNTGCSSSTREPVTAYVYEKYNIVATPQTACDSFVWNNKTYTQSGNYTDTLKTVHNCDSIVTLPLTINYTKRTTVDSTVCNSISWLNGHTYTQTNTYVDTVPAISGCDSIVTLNLTVKHSSAANANLTLCSAQLPYDYNGYQVTQAGTFTVTIDNTVGCDSVITLTVAVNTTPGNPTIKDTVRCGAGPVLMIANSGSNGGTCKWFVDTVTATSFHEGTQYNPTLSADTTFYVASFNPQTNCMSKRLPIKATINTIPEAPIVKDTARCGAGPVALDVTVADPTLNVRWYANTATGAQVLNSGLQYNIQNLNATSTYYVESINMMTGCLSNRVPITATVNDIPAMPTVSEKTNCGPDTFNLTASNTTSCRWYETATATEPLNNVAAASYHTGTISESTSYFVTNYNAETGCESGKTEQIITIFTVYPSQDLYDEVCQGDTYTGYGQNVSYTESGVKDIVLATQSSNGCDSVVTLHLTVKATDQVTLTDSVCAGVPYTLHNFDTTFATAGTYTLTHTGTNMAGCDSTTTLMLTVNPVYTPTIEKTICEGQSFNFDGIDRTEPGTYVANLQSVTGCDSIVTLHLQVSDKHIETIIAHICAGETYQANGFNESTTGTYSHTDPTPSGCDSVTVLKLFVHELNTTNLRDTICLGESYSRYNITATPTTTGDTVITRVVPTQYNCDSTVVLTLTVNPSYDLHYSGEVCQGNRYTDYGFDTLVALSGTHTLIHSTTLATGCDSTVTVTLTVNPSYDLHYSGEVCQGENYVGYGFDTLVTQVGTHTLNHSTILSTGCDSIVTVNLTVNPVFSKDTTVSVCDVDVPYAWDYNHSYSVSGDYPIHYSRVNTGCDSVINLHLIVHNSMNKDTTVQICEGALPYAFDSDHVYSTGGNYTISLNSASGCDSIYQLHLVVTPSITHTQTLNICDNQLPYPYGDSTFNAAGTYEVVTTREDGCFEITYLTLNVHPTYQHSATFNICQSGLPYQVGDSIFTEAGTKTVHFTTPHSCDSAVTVTLIVNPEYAIADADTVCKSETPYRYAPENDDIDISTPGVRTYTYNHKTVTNCDSIVTFTLTVLPAYSESRSVTLCANSEQLPYSFGDTLLMTSGVYTYNFHTAAGCDSIETLTFTVKPVYDTIITASVCQGESYIGNGFNIKSDTVGTHTYTRNLTSSLDCDSTVNLVLTVNPNYFIPENVTVHSTTLPYLWHGHEFMESTTAYDSLTTGAGCDSVYYLTLTVTEFTIVHDNPIVLCQGTSQTWRGMELSASGSYADTVVALNTIYTVDVTVNPSYHLYDTMEVCANEIELPYIWHGIRFTNDTTIEKNYQTATYCDSVYTLTFIVHPTYNIHVDTAVCGNDIPFIWHGKTVSGPGNYTDSLSTAFGCDSIHTLTVNVTYITSQEDSMTVCGENATYAWHSMTLSETGVYRDTLRNGNGCDSIVYTINFVKGIPFFHADSVVLSGNQAYEWRGRQITQAGIYFDSLQTVVGCDSVYSLVATEHQYQYIQSNPISLCPGDSAFWLGKAIYEGGTYQDTVVNGGVHYVYTVVVTMNQSYYFADTVTKCQSELPFYWHGVNRTQAGVYYDSKQTVNGCDSIYTLTLFVDSSYAYTETVTICSNEAPYIWHGNSLYASGVFYDSLQTVAGCDSIYMLTLTVNPAIRQNDTAETCQGTPYVWRGRSLQTSGFYVDSVANTYGCEDIYTLFLTVTPKNYDTVRATICLGDTYNENGFNVTPTYAGTIYDQLVLTNQYGCDSIVSLVLTVNSSYLYETVASTCDGTPYEWRGGEYVVEGTYYDNYVTATGCDSVYVLYLTVNPTYEEYVTDSIHVHETYDNYGITVTPSDTGVYTYTINGFTQSGCDSIIYLTLVVQGNIGVNDYVAPQLRVYPNPATTYVIVEGERMQTIYVYDMYGRLVQVQEVESPEYTRLSLDNMAAGNYIIRIRLLDGVMISRKIIRKQF